MRPLPDWLARKHWIDLTIERYPDTTRRRPGDLAANPTNTPHVDFDALSLGEAVGKFRHQPALRQVPDTHRPSVGFTTDTKIRHQKQAVARDLTVVCRVLDRGVKRIVRKLVHRVNLTGLRSGFP